MPRKKDNAYKIGQIARILEIEPYVLRYWENEFPQLSPMRSSKGQRLYTEEHLLLLRRIKNLLYEQGLTIEGARRKLEENEEKQKVMREIKAELETIKQILSS